MSSTVTPVALSGPRFVTTIVKTTSSVTFGVELSTLFVSSRSACGDRMTASSWSSSDGSSLSGCESGSYWSAVDLRDVREACPPRRRSAVICTRSEAPTVIEPADRPEPRAIVVGPVAVAHIAQPRRQHILHRHARRRVRPAVGQHDRVGDRPADIRRRIVHALVEPGPPPPPRPPARVLVVLARHVVARRRIDVELVRRLDLRVLVITPVSSPWP
jgi:hypothetical protein